MKGLIIKEPWANLILEGQKNMELRGSNTKIRGKIGIIKSGSKKVFGTVELIDCIQITNRDDYNSYRENHMVSCEFEDITYKKLYGWILKNPIEFKEPITYEHKLGCVIWVNLEEQ